MRVPLARRVNDRRKGATLVELVIVMLLLAIVTAVTVSFSTLVGNYVQHIHRQSEFLDECFEIRTLLWDWLSSCDDVNSSCTVSPETLSIGSASATFPPVSDSLCFTVDGDTVREYNYKTVKDIQFILGPSDGSTGKQLLKCIVKGGNEDDEFTQSFLLSFRLGSLEEFKESEAEGA